MTSVMKVCVAFNVSCETFTDQLKDYLKHVQEV
mgnify:CR=1 FL=1